MPPERSVEDPELKRQRKMQLILDREGGNHQSPQNPTMQERIEGPRAILNYQIKVRSPIIQTNFRQMQIEEEEGLAEEEKELQEYLIRLREESNTVRIGGYDPASKTLKIIKQESSFYKISAQTPQMHSIPSLLDVQPKKRKKKDGWGDGNMTREEFQNYTHELMKMSKEEQINFLLGRSEKQDERTKLILRKKHK